MKTGDLIFFFLTFFSPFPSFYFLFIAIPGMVAANTMEEES